MFFDDAFITAMNAQDVANAVQSFYDERDGSYFKLDITDSRQQHPQQLWVRPRRDQMPFTFANGQQVVKCEAQDGRAVDIIVPAHGREIVPALVILAQRTS